MREKTLLYCPDCGAVLTVEYDDSNLWCVRCLIKVPMETAIIETIREKETVRCVECGSEIDPDGKDTQWIGGLPVCRNCLVVLTEECP